MNILMSYTHYPLTVANFFKRAFKRLGIAVFSVGPYVDNIPWTTKNCADFLDIPDLEMEKANVGDMDWVMAHEKVRAFRPEALFQFDSAYRLLGTRYPNIPWVHIATDPHCVTGDTWLATDRGMMTAREISVMDSGICLADKEGMTHSSGVRQTGMKPVCTIELEMGFRLSCTNEHLIETSDGFKQAEDLQVGNKVVLACGTYEPSNDGDEKDYGMGFIIGAFQGDGSFGRQDFIKFTLHREKKRELADKIRKYLMEVFAIDCVTEMIHPDSENAIVLQIRRWGLYRFLKSCDIKSGHIPLIIRTGSRMMIAGYFSGLIAADGSSPNGLIQITNKWETLIREMQILLFYLGIPTSIREIITNEASYKPGKKYWTLYIRTGEGYDHFAELVGSIPGRVMKLNTRPKGVRNGRIQHFAITHITGAVKNYPKKRVSEPVYDVFNTERGMFLANGISVHNCLDYEEPFKVCDYPVVMQKFYGETRFKLYNPQWLPYAFDPYVHYYTPAVKEHDVTLLTGLLYPQRRMALEALKAAGIKVFTSNQYIYEEGTEIYNKGRIALNWSSEYDLPMRFWEGLAYRNVVLTNRVPELQYLPEFIEGTDFLAFHDIGEMLDKAKWVLSHPDEAAKIARNGYAKVWIGKHTYTQRAKRLLGIAGVA